MSEQIDKSTQEWLKEIGAESPDAELKNRIAKLEREVQEYKEENVKLLQTLLALHRAVKRAICPLDKIEESCDNNVWFSQLKERTY
jgi:predicted RNase H-like nuclease (RuvC/YqgF family)